MKRKFTKTRRKGLALLAALLFVYAAHAQQLTPGDFVVAYTFSSSATDVQFFALTNGTVDYSFQVFNNGKATNQQRER